MFVFTTYIYIYIYIYIYGLPFAYCRLIGYSYAVPDIINTHYILIMLDIVLVTDGVYMRAQEKSDAILNGYVFLVYFVFLQISKTHNIARCLKLSTEIVTFSQSVLFQK